MFDYAHVRRPKDCSEESLRPGILFDKVHGCEMPCAVHCKPSLPRRPPPLALSCTLPSSEVVASGEAIYSNRKWKEMAEKIKAAMVSWLWSCSWLGDRQQVMAAAVP